MRLLLFSDLHTDLAAAASIAERAADFDAIVGAGDFAVKRRGLAGIVEVLAAIETPAVLVPGNGESAEELAGACHGWPAAHVLHGTGVDIGGVSFFGLGGGVPVTPFGAWSYDFTEEEARGLLAPCPEAAVLVSHSPPLGHADAGSGGRRMGSTAVLETIERTRPRLVVCGHIHGSWGVRSQAGTTPVVNAGPGGIEWSLGEPLGTSDPPP